MTTRPELRLGRHLLPGLVAVALFALLALVFLDAGFVAGQGFVAGASITASIGYAMFNLAGGEVPSEGFLVAFEIIDFVLVAALVAAVMLARREGVSVLDTVRGGLAADSEAETARTDGGADAGSGDDADATGGEC